MFSCQDVGTSDSFKMQVFILQSVILGLRRVVLVFSVYKGYGDGIL